MRGVHAASGWTPFLAGFIVAGAGAGAGLVSVPLASIAVGVVEPERARMASGINSTLRQVGVATGIAALASILAGRLHGVVIARLPGGPLAAHAHQIANAVSDGRTAQALHATPPGLRGLLERAAQSGYAGALDGILLIAALVAFAGAALTTPLIRSRNFADAAHDELTGEPSANLATPAVI